MITWQQCVVIARTLPNVMGRMDDTYIYLLQGTLDAQPFFLQYERNGITQWYSAEYLLPAQRQKILRAVAVFRHQHQHLPSCTRHVDVRALDAQELEQGTQALAWVYTEFLDAIDALLRKDYIELKVEFKDNVTVKQLGASWNARTKRWEAPPSYHNALRAWMPT